MLNQNLLLTGDNDYNLTKSLRFRASAGAYMERTPASSGSQTKFTFSTWVKRGTLGASTPIFSSGSSGSNAFDILFTSSDTFQVEEYNVSTNYYNTTTQVFRDISAWYHIVVAIDTTQATSSNRLKIYINGSQVTAFANANYPTQNFAYMINTASFYSRVGRGVQYFNSYLDGYQAEINFVDGQQLTPSSFGSTNATTGVWQPAKYTGTYGTNGFYLPFTNTTSTTTLGYDFSGNSNNWTTNNISLTAGSTYDSMTDVPTLTDASTANYCTLNPLGQFKGTQTISNGNLQASQTSTSNYQQCFGTLGVSSGKWYWEWTPTTTLTYPTSNLSFGFITASSQPTTGGSFVLSTAFSGNIDDGTVLYTYPGGASTSISMVAGDTIGLALDLGAGTLAIYVKNVLKATISSIPAGTYVPYIEMQGSQTNTCVVNFGQRGFKYTPPTGFVALNTYNLPTSTIVKGNTVMDATTYTGNGTTILSTQNITNTASFKPDFVWLKSRSNAQDNNLYDSVRGISGTGSPALFSNLTQAETTYTGYGVSALNSNGFTLIGNGGLSNNNGFTYVGWQWQAGQGSTSSNTSGSVTSTVSVNTTAGFSVVTYTNPASGSSWTVGHGLGVAPSLIITKQRSATSGWSSYHVSLGATKAIYLQSTAAANTNNTFNNTAPTSSVISFAGLGTNYDASATMVAYCWAEIAGFSKFGSYTGNGSADGPFIYTGFKSKFILIKRTDGVSNWVIWDTTRSNYNEIKLQLFPNTSDAEDNTGACDALSNGFKLRNTNSTWNASGGTYIYMAFAENPFKNALAR